MSKKIIVILCILLALPLVTSVAAEGNGVDLSIIIEESGENTHRIVIPDDDSYNGLNPVITYNKIGQRTASVIVKKDDVELAEQLVEFIRANKTVSFPIEPGKVYTIEEIIGMLLGDVNADNAVDILDRVYLRNYLTNPNALSSVVDLVAADINCDGKVDILDRVALRNLLTKKS